MTDSNFQIIAVDNDSRELDKIRKAFDLLKTPCLPILYNEGDNIDEKYSNIRIAFFDTLIPQHYYKIFFLST